MMEQFFFKAEPLNKLLSMNPDILSLSLCPCLFLPLSLSFSFSLPPSHSSSSFKWLSLCEVSFSRIQWDWSLIISFFYSSWRIFWGPFSIKDYCLQVMSTSCWGPHLPLAFFFPCLFLDLFASRNIFTENLLAPILLSSFIEVYLTNENCICTIKVYNMMFWYMYTLWNEYHNQTNTSVTSHILIFFL